MRENNDPHPLFLSACGCRVRIICNNPIAKQLVINAFGALAVDTVYRNPDISIRVEFDSDRCSFVVNRQNLLPEFAHDQADLLYVVDMAMIVGQQQHRAALLFLHAAVVEYRNKTVIFAEPSRTGKSNLTWPLLNQGFRYISDELTPIAVNTFRAPPYRRSLLLKAAPSAPPLGDERAIRTITSIHIPAASQPGGAVLLILPLAAIFFIKRNSPSQSAITTCLGVTMAAARLLNNTFNVLAHPAKAWTRLHAAQEFYSYVLDISNLSHMHNAIVNALARHNCVGDSS